MGVNGTENVHFNAISQRMKLNSQHIVSVTVKLNDDDTDEPWIKILPKNSMTSIFVLMILDQTWWIPNSSCRAFEIHCIMWPIPEFNCRVNVNTVDLCNNVRALFAFFNIEIHLYWQQNRLGTFMGNNKTKWEDCKVKNNIVLL